MRKIFLAVSAAVILIGTGNAATAQSNLATPPPAKFGEGQEDPKAQLAAIDQRVQVREGLFPSLIQPFRDRVEAWKKRVYDRTNLELGFSFHTAYQWADSVEPGTNSAGWATDFDVVGTWELLNVGKPTQGQLFFGFEGRWEYGRPGPQTIGFSSVGAAGGTANTFSEYVPTFILRNLYWNQGSPEAGWEYGIGKITFD